VQRRIEKAEVIVDPTVFAYEGAPEDFETLELGETDYIDHPPGCAIRCCAALLPAAALERALGSCAHRLRTAQLGKAALQRMCRRAVACRSQRDSAQCFGYSSKLVLWVLQARWYSGYSSKFAAVGGSARQHWCEDGMILVAHQVGLRAYAQYRRYQCIGH
jgi:hypothetical protein